MSGGDETHSVVSALPVLWSGCLRTGQNPSAWVHISSKKSKGRGEVGGGDGKREGRRKREGVDGRQVPNGIKNFRRKMKTAGWNRWALLCPKELCRPSEI